MKAGVIVFAYNRSWYLGEGLAVLRKNQEINKFYIFQDGLKCEDRRLEMSQIA